MQICIVGRLKTKTTTYTASTKLCVILIEGTSSHDITKVGISPTYGISVIPVIYLKDCKAYLKVQHITYR